MNYSNKPVCLIAMDGLYLSEQEEQGKVTYYVGIDYKALGNQVNSLIIQAVAENIELRKKNEELERRIEILEHRMI